MELFNFFVFTKQSTDNISALAGKVKGFIKQGADNISMLAEHGTDCKSAPAGIKLRLPFLIM
ncbi:hypothetical protein, partial [Mariniphaga sediminis]|uniref:hypothetical protein n=1 Tax=Mariniphaga sediminis TaxID=1628158 RepID=UPI00356B0EC7